MPSIVLASSSPYRRALLEKLRLPFEFTAPDIDESRRDGEQPAELVARLATTKAQTVAAHHPHSWVIGSDQIAHLDQTVLGKPGDRDSAFAQLRACSGRRVEFLTGLCLLNNHSGYTRTLVEPFAVTFRILSDKQIDSYLRREQPFDCAGSFKAEGLGIALFERLEGDDPNALVGLPLIRLVTLLHEAGIAVLG